MNACLIGYNLTNFLLAILLSKKGFKVDIIFEEKNIHKSKNRTIGISKKNVEFIKSFLNVPDKYLWPIHEIEIFNLKNNPSKKIKFKDKKNENFFIIKQDYFNELSEKKCRMLKNINFKKHKANVILKLENQNKYNFIINSQSNNILIKKFFSNSIKKDYESTAFTVVINHKKFDNFKAIQVFTKYGPLAFLPLSSDKTSIVYSVQKKFRLNLYQIKNEILKYSQKYDVKKLSDLEKFDLKYSFPRKFVHKNIVCFGDALHKIHPLAGQGFNMTLRDLKLLLNLIEKKLDYGLEIDRSILAEFKDKSKHLNFIFGIGINLINEFFILDSKFNGRLSDNIFSFLDANELFKKNSISIANKGINFVTE
ncbi:FAD-dependent monooxygenase [Candidatus Pelagibacter sp.]|nr:FAD-dependent monooxygenase [Candidatus Pelagibacter sp.]